MLSAPRPRRAAPVLSRRPGPLAVLLLGPLLSAPALAADPRPAPSKPDPKASKPDPKASKPDPKASKPDPKASKPDPKASKPDPKASKPDPKASKPDPKASPTKPDPKASKPDPKASKPDPKASKPDPKASQAPTPPAPPPPPPAPAAAGYWLGARLLGPDAAKLAALEAIALPTGIDGAPDDTVAGQVETLPEAMAWVARWAFAGDPLPPPALEPADSPLHLGPAPIPGGPLFTRHGAVLHALSVRGRSIDGSTRAIRWPQTTAEVTPPGLPWLPAVLLTDRAPLFAAPAARVPPAAERFAHVRRSGHLWILGHVDRCSAAAGERVCLRWAQVVAREGDEFRAGYLPAYQLAPIDGWRRGAGAAPRAMVLASGTIGARAQFLLIARTRDGGLHRKTLEAPLVGDAFPAARVRVEGEWATIEFTGAKAQRVALDASLDARER
jgi:hypothetical protein